MSAATLGASPSPDRAAIAQAVEHVMTHLGIPRGAAAPGSTGPSAPAGKTAPPKSPAPEKPSGPAVLSFVSEGDVRRAVTRGEKLLIGPKTILTPSARDVAGADGVLVLTDEVPAKPAAAASE
jgi:hypothetical protein